MLFCNSVGRKIGKVSDNIKIVLPRYGIKDVPSVTNIRHMVVTAAFQLYDSADRDTISTALCHNPSTGLRHYVNDKTGTPYPRLCATILLLVLDITWMTRQGHHIHGFVPQSFYWS